MDLYANSQRDSPIDCAIASGASRAEHFGNAIDDAFARWDRSHLHEFILAGGTVITPARWWDSEEPEGSPAS